MAHLHPWVPVEHFLLHRQCNPSLALTVDNRPLPLQTQGTPLLRHLATIIHHLPLQLTIWNLMLNDNMLFAECRCQEPWAINRHRTQQTPLTASVQVSSQWAHTTRAQYNPLHRIPRFLDSTIKDRYLRFVIRYLWDRWPYANDT